MKKELDKAYGLNIISLVKKTDKVYEVIDENDNYLLKRYDNRLLENIFTRLSIINMNEFLIPLKTNNDRFFIKIDGKEYCLFKKYYEEDIETKDIKLNYYINAIGNLHKKSFYKIKSSDGYLKETILFLDRKREEIKEDILFRISSIERLSYLSPNDWFFYMNYMKLYDSIRESERFTSLLEEEIENIHTLRIALTYQNFSYEHILPKENIIVSIDKMAYGNLVYDLIDIIDKTYYENIDISSILSRYESINELEIYEKYYLLAYIYIPSYKRETNPIDDIYRLSLTLDRLDIASSLASSFSLEKSSE